MLKCFIVDDEALMLELFEGELKKLGAKVTKFDSGRALFDILQNDHPDILFLDIQMPEMDGFEILVKVRERLPQQYIIMVSGDSNIENVKKSIELGSNGFLVKPINPKKLKESLDTFRSKQAD